FNSFQTIAKGSSSAFEKYRPRIEHALQNPDYYLDNEQEMLSELCSNIQNYLQEQYLRLELNKDSLLEFSSFQHNIGRELIKEIQTADQDIDFEIHMNRLFQYFAIDYSGKENRTYLLTPGKGIKKELLKLIPPNGLEISY